MSELKNLNIEKSIATKKLQYTKSWGEYLDPVLFYFFIGFGFIIIPIKFYSSKVNYYDPNDKFMAIFVFPIVISIGIYLVFNKLTEKYLKRIKTKFTKTQNHQLILEFAKNEGYSVRRKSNNCIILDKFYSNQIHRKTAILFLIDDKIYFTMISSSHIFNTPTFISHHIFRRRILKWLNKPKF
jgi:hypothetical protein